jgi:drug/metabolite transporter (DMT)-like permease
MTVVLAWRLQRERIGRTQAVGLGLAGVGLVLIAAG